MSAGFARVDEVVEADLCLGCGACQPVCPEASIRIVDQPHRGGAILVDDSTCRPCRRCVEVCPGVELQQPAPSEPDDAELARSWGPVHGIWEGHAVDPEIRFRGASGGVVTAIGTFALEHLGVAGVVHVGRDPDAPLRNRTLVSTCRKDLLAAAGSHYSPAAPCADIERIRECEGPVVVVGKPCDIAALGKLGAFFPFLADRVMFTVAIFCAGTPSTSGSHEIVREAGGMPDEVQALRYRGRGWPGATAVELRSKDGCQRTETLDYRRAWSGLLTFHVASRCRICPDGTGQFADIAVGDPWHRNPPSHPRGYSLVLARTAQGREILGQAMTKEALRLWTVEGDVLAASQPSLLRKRRELLARLLARRVAGLRIPRYRGFSLFYNGWQLPRRRKLAAFREYLARMKALRQELRSRGSAR